MHAFELVQSSLERSPLRPGAVMKMVSTGLPPYQSHSLTSWHSPYCRPLRRQLSLVAPRSLIGPLVAKYEKVSSPLVSSGLDFPLTIHMVRSLSQLRIKPGAATINFTRTAAATSPCTHSPIPPPSFQGLLRRVAQTGAAV